MAVRDAFPEEEEGKPTPAQATHAPDPPQKFEDGFTLKSIIGAIFIALIMLPGGMYLGLVAGQGVGEAAEWVTIVLFAEVARRSFNPLRKQEIYEILASVQADQPGTFSSELAALARDLPEGGTLVLMLSHPDTDLPKVLGSLSGLQKVCLLYDANDYRPARLGRLASAADPGYMGRLRDAGAEVFVMPKGDANWTTE